MGKNGSASTLKDYLAASYPAVLVQTIEENRVVPELRDLCTRSTNSQRKVFEWSIVAGLREVCPNGSGGYSFSEAVAETEKGIRPTLKAMKSMLDEARIRDSRGESFTPIMFILYDVNNILVHGGQTLDAWAVRKIRDMLVLCEETSSPIVFVQTTAELPPDLERQVQIVDYPLPTESDLADTFMRIYKNNKDSVDPFLPKDCESEQDIKRLIGSAATAALGLTAFEASNAVSLSIMRGKAFNPPAIMREKRNALVATGAMELMEPIPMDQVGGLGVLKQWFRDRIPSIQCSKEAQEFGLAPPPGLLMTGIPGTGKSLSACAIAGELGQLPIRLDVGALFRGIVGESEATIRRVLRTAEAMAPCVLVIDEVDKAFGSGGEKDGGVADRIKGIFLTWMQEKKDKNIPVFVVATCNDYNRLPSELTRAGRWAETMFIDLPERSERISIFNVHFRKRGWDMIEDHQLSELADLTHDYSGADIEQTVEDGLTMAFGKYGTRAALKEPGAVAEFVAVACKQRQAISKVNAKDVASLRDQAKRFKRANDPKEETTSTTPGARRLAATE